MVVMELLVMRQWSQYFHYIFVVQYLSLQQTLGKLQRERARERKREGERESDRNEEGGGEHKNVTLPYV